MHSVFVSYARADEALREELETHLSLLKRQGLISIWHDGALEPGGAWRQTIEEEIENASIILLLVSPDFVASDFCYDIEMERALKRHHTGMSTVIPVILRPTDWTHAPFATLQSVPRNGKPITSWPERDAAFLDVVKAIRTHLERFSKQVEPEGFFLPFTRNPYFVGRQNIFGRIREDLHQNRDRGSSCTAALCGLGGIGKTQTALEYAWRYRDQYRTVFYVHAETESELRAGFCDIARILHLPETDLADQEITVQEVKKWLASEKRWLLLLDSADEPSLLKPFLPQNHQGHILLTSRAQVFQNLGIRNPIHLSVPSAREALDLLLVRTQRQEVDNAERQAAARLAKELGFLPLALEQAGAYILELEQRFTDYLKAYRQRGIELLEDHPPVVEGHPHPVSTTWTLSFQKVEAASLAAADLLKACAFLAASPISEELLLAGAAELGPHISEALFEDDPLAIGRLLAPLSRYSLIRRNLHERTWSVHRLVQEAVKASLEPNERALWSERIIRAVEASFPWPEFSAWPTCRQLLPHAIFVSQLDETGQLDSMELNALLNSAADYLQRRGRFEEAEPLLRRALKATQRYLGDHHPVVATGRNNLAEILRRQHRFKEAEPLLNQALEVRLEAYGENHPEVASALNNLALLRGQQEKHSEAEVLCRRALDILERLSGKQHSSVASTLNNLAIIYRTQQRLKEAEKLYLRSLHIREDELGPNHPEVAASRNNLALLYEEQGRVDEAEKLYALSFDCLLDTLGPHHPNLQQAADNFARFLRSAGRPNEASRLFARLESPDSSEI